MADWISRENPILFLVLYYLSLAFQRRFELGEEHIGKNPGSGYSRLARLFSGLFVALS
jgi:hypothetical protein